MFIDETTLVLGSGDGGDGAVSFRREKYAEKGGPDGGDGGRGGDLYVESTKALNTLINFSNIRKLKAENGEKGKGSNMYGKSGEDLVVKVPVGTMIRELGTGRLIADFDKEKRILFLKGGAGGKGNVRFKSPRRQAPYIALKGQKGLEIEVKLELKLLADVALVGLPNAGKSSFINSVSAAKSKVGDYPFTTLEPKLGVVRIEDRTFTVSDIPGLIKGAAEGRGLGHKFLRHIERARLIFHLIDLSEENLIEKFEQINEELREYSENLSQKRQIAVGTKIDLELSEEVKSLEKYLKKAGVPFFKVSSATKEGIKELLSYAVEELKEEYVPNIEEVSSVYEFFKEREKPDIKIRRDGDVYKIEGRIVDSVDRKYVMTGDAFDILQDILRKHDLDKKLKEAGAKTGDSVELLGQSMEFVE